MAKRKYGVKFAGVTSRFEKKSKAKKWAKELSKASGKPVKVSGR